MESAFAMLKSKYFYLSEQQNIPELCIALDDDIRYLNQERIKQKLRGLRPAKYRTQAQIVA